jgi:exosortase J
MTENLELSPLATEKTAPGSEVSWPLKTRLLVGCGIAVLTAAGCLGIYPELHFLWAVWTSDPLRSIGMLIPPASIVLTLRVWRQHHWEMRGSWWGLLVIGLAFFLSALRQRTLLIAVIHGAAFSSISFGQSMVSFIPISLPVYVYGSGIVLLFAGMRVWRKAWFPLGLLLLSQPVPGLLNGLIDIPLQNASARVARSFATWIHFAPTTTQLRLMFSPNFGMFIAPGCDGIRGAVTMGYVVLILGYLKRVSWRRWLAYVAGAVLLGYVFNFLRLCLLVLYYRIALGHPTLENVAKQADYGIGSCLFLVATVLFLRLARHEQLYRVPVAISSDSAGRWPNMRTVSFKFAAFAVTVLAALAIPSSAFERSPKATATPESLAARIPRQVGAYALTRTWYEQQDGTILEENGAYSAPGSDEVILGVWLAPVFYFHSTTDCWLARGLQPDLLTTRQFLTAEGRSLALNMGFYNDGVTDSIVINAVCTPGSCSQYQPASSSGRIGFLFLQPQMDQLAGVGKHPVSIMVRIDKLHSSAAKQADYDLLATEAQRFLAGLDPLSVSRAFQ